MKNMGLNKLREKFLSFYETKEHYRKNSFSLIPHNDKSLLLVNSGMAPMKNYFAGIEKPPAPRMVTCQKCIRTGDIENVGLTARHGTFFEMLGSFSFGDYFKEESIVWGWEFVTEVLEIPEDKLWATIYEDDDQAYNIWKDVIGISEEKIVRLGKDDNFWEIGLGPCGPCSEIYFDRGPDYGCDNPECKPGCECDRYLEFWNHVFTQFSKEEDGSYSNLAHPNIDTGMGLERLACILQGVDSIFDVDTIKVLLNAIVDKAGVEYKDGKAKTDISIRLITDHLRSMTFMIGDGILPSNEGRGYVLRRLLRRAARHGKLLGIEGSFLAELADTVIDTSKEAYPELVEKRDYIRKVISVEEAKFADTIDQGTNIIASYIEEIKQQGQTVLDGNKVFKLYDTYGFPPELTEEILAENGCSADIEGFNTNMKHQKEQARAARKDNDDQGWHEMHLDFEEAGATYFSGYETLTDQAKVKIIILENEKIDQVSTGETALIAMNRTPFYAEGGGQASDKGIIFNDNFKADVLDVTKNNNIYIHRIHVNEGLLAQGDTVQCEVNVLTRNNIARNHSATHLLHKALRTVLGEHVQQAGSSVTSNSLRFDFTHFESISKEDLNNIEEIVNTQIINFLPVNTHIMSPEEASKLGAMALFGEKYGEMVRVLSIGDFSMELCGGTHVANSGQIGVFKILSEGGIAAGVRRIEAVTGIGILSKMREAETLLSETADLLKTNVSGVPAKAAALSEEVKIAKKEVEEFKRQSMNTGLDDIISSAENIKGIKLITKAFNDYNINDLRALSDSIKASHKGIIMVFATINDGKVTFLVSVTDDVLEKGYHAGNMIKQIAASAGGGGGGKADMAQAGAKDPSKIEAAFEVAKTLI
ncbi:MAG: alanine--tRNA ligase [Eubacteriales bacterium]|nr:alanine--tRNA ligase [Eubacteriales bacterium]MDD4389436.1 alanine--tRNA ligase [Eubacteriales bacterium]